MSLNYQKALEAFKQLAKDTDWYAEFSTLAVALQENLHKEMLFGSTEQARRDRYELIHRLDTLASIHKLPVIFSELCMNPSFSNAQQTEDTSTAKQEKESLPLPTRPELYGNGDHWAVIVGINHYEDTRSYAQLQVCAHDATILYKQLIAGGFKDRHIRILTDQRDRLPLRENILAELQVIAEATGPDDLLLFYFSGHGQAERDEGYLVPRNGRGVALHDTAVPINRVKEIIGKAQARAKVIILDACHSGANLEAAKGKRPMSAEFINNVFKGAVGLAIISSCKEGQYSYEWQEKQCSVFTYHLIEALQGKADHDEKGFVTVQDVNRYVTNGVKQWALEQLVSQSPTLHYLVSGDIVLTEYVPHHKTAIDTTPPDEQEPGTSEKPTTPQESSAKRIQPYIGDLATLRDGHVHQELTEQLAREEGIRAGSRGRSSVEDILERYRSVPLHALFLYTAADREIETYIVNHWGELDQLSGDVCDIHPVVSQFKHPQDENAYAFIEDITILRKANFSAYSQLPVLFFWDRNDATEYISFGNPTDAATITRILRQIFEELRREPTIAAVTRVKKKLEQSEEQLPSMQQPDPFMYLYKLLEEHTADLDLREICRSLRVNYNRLSGNSHAERAFSLTKQLENENRLSELEKELRHRLPGRFSDR